MIDFIYFKINTNVNAILFTDFRFQALKIQEHKRKYERKREERELRERRERVRKAKEAQEKARQVCRSKCIW